MSAHSQQVVAFVCIYNEYVHMVLIHVLVLSILYIVSLYTYICIM